MNTVVKTLIMAGLVLPLASACRSLESKALAEQTKQTVYRPQAPCLTCLRLIRDPHNRKNHQGNPIYRLETYLDGHKIYTMDTVTGRAHTQNFNRNLVGSEAPLPDGKYNISRQIVPGTIPEVGETFIAVYPQFRTGRIALGIHYDPSYNQNNGEDGTSGCIGLTNKSDRHLINQFVQKYHPKELIVEIN